jgi:hypothetical protein
MNVTITLVVEKLQTKSRSQSLIMYYYYFIFTDNEASICAFGLGTAPQEGGFGFDFRWDPLNLSSDLILPSALRSTQPMTEMSTKVLSWG